jgi:hypothetical protein
MSTGSVFFSQSGGNSLIKAASTYSNLQFSGDFTIEFFIKCGASVRDYDYPTIVSTNTDYAVSTCFYFHVSHPDIVNKIGVFNGLPQYQPSNIVLASTNNINDNQWHHVAVVRNGTGSNNLKMYVDGSLNSTNTNTTLWDYSNLVIGGNQVYITDRAWYKGSISNLRMLNGTALYTSNFIVPRASLQNITNTVLLLNTAFSSPYMDSSSFNRTISAVGTPTPSADSPVIPFPCFKEDTKILVLKDSSEQFVAVQELRKGDLVKTLCNGFVPIHLIGKKDIVHTSDGPRDKNKLYKCTQENYPEVVEDLVITGCHSILVDEFVNDKQREDTMELFGDIYVTDSKYRLPACLDERSSIYEEDGTFTIYHIALDNENYYYNYGIFANGLLVESCSIRYLKELSNMELI